MRLSTIPYSTALGILQLSGIVQCLSVPPRETAGSMLSSLTPPSASNDSVLTLGFHWEVIVTCAPDGYPVEKRRIAEGIAEVLDYLKNKITGYPILGAMSSGRYDRKLWLNSYGDIANGAQKILDKCSPGDKYVSGEAWFYEVNPTQEGGWVVMVEYTRC
ncbi:hypothetical protein SMACR_09340 [Sordaria macrospora]|uniref:WGS project CABT00000000 data, contig 2.86 n=2 Tax=Sordaria macrospora TaxID=5147 RepID=F7WBW3_SORMK|nr:uncharacterized protein SMAC_09340 [Sordaria macrospora k-hell]KAA8629405.1 hypothetical protein SMACR_09340 [Sordaria macrospora]WPJ65057.1 hypothetical protein SMAC4_09340 [Sordaria macrospora]CCC05493.1 unnamed protein product [Sordaria macrospora k-hell]